MSKKQKALSKKDKALLKKAVLAKIAEIDLHQCNSIKTMGKTFAKWFCQINQY